MLIRFNYNGKSRTVMVTKARASYVQGFNLHEDKKSPGATYTISKMSDIEILHGDNEWIRTMLKV